MRKKIQWFVCCPVYTTRTATKLSSRSIIIISSAKNILANLMTINIILLVIVLSLSDSMKNFSQQIQILTLISEALEKVSVSSTFLLCWLVSALISFSIFSLDESLLVWSHIQLPSLPMWPVQISVELSTNISIHCIS